MAARRIPFAERWRSKVDPNPTERGCLLWTGATNSHGYGTIRRGLPDQKTIGAHVAAWELEHGPVPEGLCVLHECDVRRCVNVAHLFLGTKVDNNADRDAKGRTARGDASGRRKYPNRWPDGDLCPPERKARGERQGLAKLTEEQVREIRRLRADGLGVQEIADRFAIRKTNVSAICLRQTWKHIP